MLGSIFNIGDTITFDVYPSNVIPGRYENVLVVSAPDGEMLRELGKDPLQKHTLVYPSLPPGSINNPYAYSYLKIQHPNRDIEYIGLPWIIEATVVRVQSIDILVRIRGKTALDVSTIQLALSSNGISLDSDSISIVPATSAP